MRCPQCGYVQVRSEECVRCGISLTQFRPRPSRDVASSGSKPVKPKLPTLTVIPSDSGLQDKKDSPAAAWLNFFFPGIGYIYAGRRFFGISLLVIFIFCALGTILGIYALLPISMAMSFVSTLDSYLDVRKPDRTAYRHFSGRDSRLGAIQVEELDADSPMF